MKISSIVVGHEPHAYFHESQVESTIKSENYDSKCIEITWLIGLFNTSFHALSGSQLVKSQ